VAAHSEADGHLLTWGAFGNSLSAHLQASMGIPLDWEIPRNQELLIYPGRSYLAKAAARLTVHKALRGEHVSRDCLISYFACCFPPKSNPSALRRDCNKAQCFQ
jgi:hypothetical protein